MEVREIGETTNFDVSGVDEITGEEIPLRVTVFNDLSRVVVSFKAMQIGAPYACLSLTKDTILGRYSLLIRDSEEMPDITFAVSLKKDDFIALIEHTLLPDETKKKQ